MAYLTTIRLLSYMLGIRVLQFFRWNPGQVLGYGLLVLLVLSYGFAIAILLNRAPDLDLAPQRVVGVVNLSVVIITMVRNFFPTYRPTLVSIQTFYPMSRWGRGLVNVVHDLLTGYLLLVIAFCVLLVFWARAYDLSSFAVSVQSLLAAMLLERSFRLTIEYRLGARVLHGLFAMTISGLLIWEVFSYTGPVGWTWWITGTFLIAFCHHLTLAYLAENPDTLRSRIFIREEAATSGERYGIFPLGLRAYYRQRIVLITLGVAVIVKGFVLAFFGWLLAKNELHTNPFLGEVFLLVASPVPLFNYIFNNTYGHALSIWQTLHLHRGDFCTAFTAYLHLVAFPLFLDWVLSCVVVWLVGVMSFRFLIFYLGSVLCLIAIGFMGSVLRPIRVEALPSFTHLRSNVSVLISYVVVLPVVGLYTLLFDKPSFYVVISLGTMSIWGVLLVIHARYRQLKHNAHAIFYH